MCSNSRLFVDWWYYASILLWALCCMQLHSSHRQFVSTTQLSSLRSGIQLGRNGTTAWHQCIIAVPRQLLLCMTLQTRYRWHLIVLLILTHSMKWLPSVLWHHWFGVRRSIWSMKFEHWGLVIWQERGTDCLHMVQLMPLPSRNYTISCFIII